jgi:hypothetical protein
MYARTLEDGSFDVGIEEYDPEREELDRRKAAIAAGQAALGQYATPHSRQAAEAAIAAYVFELGTQTPTAVAPKFDDIDHEKLGLRAKNVAIPIREEEI